MTTTNTKIAILVGAGAVENAWEPILNVFRLAYGNETDADCANFLFAKSICALRLYSKFPKGAKQLKKEQETVSLMKAVIGDLLTHAQKAGILKHRKEFAALLENPYNDFC